MSEADTYSPFVGALPSQNQHLPVTGQLDLGIRFLTAQVHTHIPTYLFCHHPQVRKQLMVL